MSDRAADLVPDVIRTLTQAAEPFSLLAPEEGQRLFRALETRFPFGRWGGIAWDEVPGHLCHGWADWEDCGRQLDALCERLRLEDVTEVLVFWTNMRSPSLRLALGTVRRHAPVVFAADFDTWLFAERERWCFQAHHDGQLCFGYAPRE